MSDAEPTGRERSSPTPVGATRRALTLARGVALAVIAVVVFGLATMRFAPGGRPVPVPAGAKGGDLILHPCRYQTESGSAAADCGTLVVPENRANPRSRLIALPVARVRARSGAARAAPRRGRRRRGRATRRRAARAVV